MSVPTTQEAGKIHGRRITRRELAMLIGWISFGHHGLHYSPFLDTWNDAGYMGFYDRFVVLVLEHGFGFGPVAVV